MNVKDSNKESTECRCWRHPQEVLSIICMDCDSPGCTVCSIKDHNGHHMITVKEGLDMYRLVGFTYFKSKLAMGFHRITKGTRLSKIDFCGEILLTLQRYKFQSLSQIESVVAV